MKMFDFTIKDSISNGKNQRFFTKLENVNFMTVNIMQNGHIFKSRLIIRELEIDTLLDFVETEQLKKYLDSFKNEDSIKKESKDENV